MLHVRIKKWAQPTLRSQGNAHVPYSAIFSGRQPHQSVKTFQCFRDWICHKRALLMTWCPVVKSSILKMGMESVPEMSENFYTNTAVCPRRFYWILLLQKLQDMYLCFIVYQVQVTLVFLEMRYNHFRWHSILF